MSNISAWSTTAASNNSESPDGFKENMYPSQVNDSARELMASVRTWYEDAEWRDWGHTVTRTGNTTFTIAADVTAIYTPFRPIRCADSATLYGYVVSSSYSNPNTTVTVTLDSGNLSASLTAVALGVIPGTRSIPRSALRHDVVGPYFMENVGLAASVSSKALTIALKGKDGNDPATSNPVVLAFRSATATTGTPVVRTAVAATSVVVPSGGTLGFTAAEDGLIYVYAIDNASTVELAVAKKALFDESITHNTTAIGTGSDSDNVLYSTSARTGVAVKLIARIRITTGATAGEWDNAATRVEPWMPGMKKTGDIIQTAYGDTSASTSSSTVMPSDNTIPQITEGAELVGSVVLQATSSINFIELSYKTQVSAGGAIGISTAAFDGASDAVTSDFITIPNASYGITSSSFIRYKSGSTSSKTYSLRFGPESAGTVFANSKGSSGAHGGKLYSNLIVKEVQA